MKTPVSRHLVPLFHPCFLFGEVPLKDQPRGFEIREFNSSKVERRFQCRWCALCTQSFKTPSATVVSKCFEIRVLTQLTINIEHQTRCFKNLADVFGLSIHSQNIVRVSLSKQVALWNLNFRRAYNPGFHLICVL